LVFVRNDVFYYTFTMIFIRNIAFLGERKLALVRAGTAFLGALLLPWTTGSVFAESVDGFYWANA